MSKEHDWNIVIAIYVIYNIVSTNSLTPIGDTASANIMLKSVNRIYTRERYVNGLSRYNDVTSGFAHTVDKTNRLVLISIRCILHQA